jgi:hypothetical protein
MEGSEVRDQGSVTVTPADCIGGGPQTIAEQPPAQTAHERIRRYLNRRKRPATVAEIGNHLDLPYCEILSVLRDSLDFHELGGRWDLITRGAQFAFGDASKKYRRHKKQKSLAAADTAAKEQDLERRGEEP